MDPTHYSRTECTGSPSASCRRATLHGLLSNCQLHRTPAGNSSTPLSPSVSTIIETHAGSRVQNNARIDYPVPIVTCRFYAQNRRCPGEPRDAA